MRKLRVGVWVEPNYAPKIGGGFSYNRMLLEAVAKHSFEHAEIIFLSTDSSGLDAIISSKKYIIKWQPLVLSLFDRLINKFYSLFDKKKKWLFHLRKAHREKLLLELSSICDLIYYPIPVCKYDDFPYIMTIWDLGYLNTYTFPEVILNRELELREKFYNETARKALLVFAESKTGKDEIKQYIGLNENRVKVLPLFPGNVISEHLSPEKPERIKAEEKFIHYPAQFWSHKNHYHLLHAFKKVLTHHPDLKLIFCGADKGNHAYIQKVINELALDESIINLEFISDQELKWLYLHSNGLIFPTLLGPTNMPPLEALYLNCPVAVSDLPGHREQLGDHALYFDPLNEEEITSSIIRLISTKKTEQKVNIMTSKNLMVVLDLHFKEASKIRFVWG